MRFVLRHIVLGLLLTMTAFAQNVAFVASADRTTVGAGEQFEVSFTVSASDVNGAKNFKPPILTPFVVLSGPNQSTNMQFVNGQMSGSVTFTYYLYTRQTGKFTIAPATIEYKGTTLKSQPLQIEVTQGKPQTQGKEPDNTQNVADNLYIRAAADKQRVRQGEPVTVTYKLYTRLQVSGYDIAKAPVYQGFWAEEVEQPKQPVVTTETVDGKQFRVATIRKTALFPTQSGKLTISPLEVRCAFQLSSRKKTNDPFDSFFNDPFFSRTQTVEQDLKSNALSVTVDPLPGSPPAGFTGAVGCFTFSASVDKKEVKTGDPITVKLTISGAGNVKLLTPPKPELPADFEAYDPKISEEVTRDGGVIRGKKTAEYLVIPRNAGDRAIEPIAFSYFDLDRNAYNTLRSARFDFKVIPGKDMSGGAAIASKSNIQLLGEDIRFLKLSMGELHSIDESLFSSDLLVACLALPPFVFIAAFGYRRRQEKLSGKVDQLKFAKAGREASRRLKVARKLLLQGNTESYHAEVSKAIFSYLEDKLHISKASLTMDEAARLLGQRGVASETIESLRACIERAEFARFAPASDTKEARTEILDAATAMINTIEKSLRRKA
ncbi:MAG: BatD family protein [Ignavibacteriales bacterium]|nr:BatD family protein [Ignavibacteriales bacterium]